MHPDIKAIAYSAFSGKDNYTTCSMRFYNKEGKELRHYAPRARLTSDKVIFSLADNEELIGVYGVKGRFDYFTTLGFIVKVKIPI